jgi:hypothetical protein
MHGPTAEYEGDKAKLERFIVALNASPSTLCLDECRDYMIGGGNGHIYATPKGFWMMYGKGGAKAWTYAKRQLPFCTVTQDTESEGCLFMDRVPTVVEAVIIRKVYRINKRTEYSPEALERVRENARSMRRSKPELTSARIIDPASIIPDRGYPDSGQPSERTGDGEVASSSGLRTEDHNTVQCVSGGDYVAWSAGDK